VIALTRRDELFYLEQLQHEVERVGDPQAGLADGSRSPVDEEP
jgi:hypothetical protein